MQTSWKLTLKNITWKPQELVELGGKKTLHNGQRRNCDRN